MTTNQAPAAIPANPYVRLSEAENQRAVERIESAERESPHCLCGASMIAAAHDGSVWLECVDQPAKGSGITGFIASIKRSLGHTRRIIMELPTADRAA